MRAQWGFPMNRLILLGAHCRLLSAASLIVMTMVLMTNQASGTPKYYIGAGILSCGAWLEARRSRAQVNDLQSWVLGYVSGVNARDNDDFLVEPDAQAIYAWLDSYCPQHPLEKLVEATEALIYDLTMRAALAKTKPR